MIAPARLAAYEILRSVSNERADLPSAIAHQRGRLSDERDRGLAAEIAHGVQRWRAKLDFLIVAIAKRPLERLDPEIVDILRLSAYQLLHLSRVPASAVVDDAVSMAGRMRKKSAGGLVNAVLRGMSRSRNSLPLPDRPMSLDNREAVLDYLAVTLSHPRWLAARWLNRVGFERAEAWLRFNNEPAPITLRVNPLHTSRDQLASELEDAGVRTHQGRYAPGALIVDEGHVMAHDALADGRCVVQDEASQLVTLLAGAAPGPRVFDTCAAPGGKATAIAADTTAALVVAADVRARRMRLLADTVRRTGVNNVVLVQADLQRGAPFGDRFSCVFVDAPCSGLGTLRRDPDLKWRRREADLPRLAAAQREMLANAAATVAPGGRLVYATCSTEPEENDAVADDFLNRHPSFQPIARDRIHSALTASLVGADHRLRTEPDRHGLEGFFGAVFERLD